ncbi:MAG: TonB-dependent receptor [Alphaproteobacteria bacterium]|nr:MAG: TonB-dependent receptor [Alphaproteobacteria bacterium]
MGATGARFRQGKESAAMTFTSTSIWVSVNSSDPGSREVFDEHLSAKWVTDVEFAYDFTDWFTLAAGANNVFDVYPDVSPTGPRPDGGNFSVFNQIFPYSNFSPFGFNGRFIYARGTLHW